LPVQREIENVFEPFEPLNHCGDHRHLEQGHQ
jgi:hypothetical protein